ncbi:hypothetical protein A1O1_04859 [Capronia coronata CBS 617.96]|uniref:Uncharacterized protein n=1 Tax=Capronia coronata CBS 617.96 TaxID=1182541 RepID=W9Y553_9EURO|nr:uncharacterized protein A1O1_04859 [Capronia coronata CBS 617.96]EXJ87932.1 hypothetical protein A1O1_04859 [Capronia coronata CBS 617.96]
MPARIEAESPTGSTDTSTSVLAKLSQPHFDPVDFLNETLPVLHIASQTQPQKASRTAHIQTVSTETLAVLNALNTLNIRASSELSALTDEIIRSGNRLAYEVEVLRGDVNGLHDLLTESLRDDISRFVQSEVLKGTLEAPDAHDYDLNNGQEAEKVEEPEFMTQLRSLGKVKTRLEAVIALFGEAMKWPIPPSELSMASSLISVSSPELGIQSTEEDDKAREVLKGIRTEITDLLDSVSGGYAGLEAATQRVEAYRQLSMLWKGTGEERARTKFVDSLVKIVEDRKKALGRGGARNARADGSGSSTGWNQKGLGEGGGAAGLFRNLQRLKDDLYLE